MVPTLSAAARSTALLLLLAVVVVSATVLLSRSDPTSAGGTIFTVDNTDDPGFGGCVPGGCTLREAIDAANLSQGNTIAFALPGCPGIPANCVIQLGSALPTLAQMGTRIDGSTQAGYAGAPIVTIDGTGLPPSTPALAMGSTFIDVKALVIRDFPGPGLDASAAFLEGLEFTDNWITNNDGDGIWLGPSWPAGAGHQILRNTISDNGGTGINNGTNCMEDAQIVGNTITGHSGIGKAGIELCGANQIHFNRISGNDVGIRDHGYSSISAAENNWWGCNEGPTNSDCDPSDQTDGAADYDPWLVLEFAASPSAILTGETSILGADLRMNSDGADTSGSGYLPDNTEVLFQTDLGSVGSPSVVVSTVGGLASATLTADAGPGTAHVSAGLDNEVQNDLVTITAAPTPTPTPEPTPEPTPTPTPTAEPTATPTPTPTPTASPVPRVQGDVNCDGNVTSVDSLGILRFVAGMPPLVQQEPCPDIGTGGGGFFGDVDCKNLVNAVDSLGILRFVALLSPLAQQEPCTDVGGAPATGT